jgi:transposase
MLPFYTHQHVELPEIKMEVSHLILHECDCPNCGKPVKAQLPADKATGYGPRLSAFIAEMSGIVLVNYIKSYFQHSLPSAEQQA